MLQSAFPMPDSYYWIRFLTTSENSETDQFLLMEFGALGTEEDDLGGLRVKGSFGSKEIWEQARTEFIDRMGLEWGEEPWMDWDQSWRDRQIPVKVTERLSVCPPWVKPPSGAESVIRLEAKMAFGTGSHESTRIAAYLMETQDFTGKTLLDVGTGTGILAIYGAMLGAKFSVGFDVDPVTGPCLAENLRLNPSPTAKTVSFFVGTMEALKTSRHFDAIICNMIRTEAWPLLPAMVGGLKPGGHLVMSGQRVEDQAIWRPWLEKNSGANFQDKTMEEWWGFIFQKEPPHQNPQK